MFVWKAFANELDLAIFLRKEAAAAAMWTTLNDSCKLIMFLQSDLLLATALTMIVIWFGESQDRKKKNSIVRMLHEDLHF